MQSDKGSNQSTAPIRVSISRKINKTLKGDLDELDRVISAASNLKSSRLTNPKSAKGSRLNMETALPNKIDLNIGLNEDIKNPPKASSRIQNPASNPSQTVPHETIISNPALIQTKLPTHKYPFLRDEFVSVDELRSRVYHGTVGVVPVRQSAEVKGLNFVMKGKPLSINSKTDDKVPTSASNDYTNNDYYYYKNKDEAFDEGIEEPSDDEEEEEEEDSDEENFDHSPNMNTPVTTNFEIYDKAFANKFDNPYKQENIKNKLVNDYYLTELIKFRSNTQKPAILPQTGTAGTALFVERPKPAKKYKTLDKNLIKRKKINIELDPGKHLTEAELQQLELEKEVKNLILDAKKTAKLTTFKNKLLSSSRLKKKASKEQVSDQTENITTVSDEPVQAPQQHNTLNEKMLLKSVEELIMTIKSGELIKEQELSNKRIQEILSTVLDKTSLALLDPSFSDKDKEGDTISQDNEMTTVDQDYILQHSHEESLKVPSEKVEQTTRTSSELKTLQFESMAPNEFSIQRSTNEGYYIETERTEIKSQSRNAASEYDEEIDEYLASLPEKVSYEDVFNTTAKQVKLFEKPERKKANLVGLESYNMSQAQKAKPDYQVPKKTTEEKFTRNLHLFCMLEHERRNLLLLPDELINVTRKYHTRNKFQFIKTFKNSQSRTSKLSVSSVNSLNKKTPTNLSVSDMDRDDANTRTNEAAKRVFDNLVGIMNFEDAQKQDDVKSVNDSGIGDDSLDSWRLQAENALNDDYKLEAKRAMFNKIENMSDFTLTFLKPAPPKMSVRPSQIRKFLFPRYKSMPPPADDLNLLAKPRFSRKKIDLSVFKSKSNLRPIHSNSSKYNYIDDLEDDSSNIMDEALDSNDEDLYDDSEAELQIVMEKVLSRQYNSETDLSKLKTDQEPKETEGAMTEDEFIFAKEPRLIRTLSDSIISRRKTDKNTNEYAVEDEEESFLKINSNYNDSIEEVIHQKQRIKQNFMTKNRLENVSIVSNAQNLGSHTTEIEDLEVQKIENKPSIIPEDQAANNDSRQTKTTEFFPKTYTKSLAEQALEAGKNYIIIPSNKKNKKENKQLAQRLNLDQLDKVEKEINESNVKLLTRSESVDRLKLKKRIRHPDDILFQIGPKIRKQRRPSLSNLCKFDDFKENYEYYKSKWFTNKDTFYDNEREWIRDIWNVWFDQVIPRLDGTYGPENGDEEEEKSLLELSLNNPKASVVTTKKTTSMSKISSNSTTKVDSKSKIGTTNASNNASRVQFIQESTNTVKKVEKPGTKMTNRTRTTNTTMTGTGNEEEDDEDAPRIIKSPTPYINYERVELGDDINAIDLESVKLVEREIEKLTARIESKAAAFDLARRGSLYRKLGFIKLALDDLNKALSMEKNFVDAYWQRHLIYLVQDRKVDALEDLNLILKLNRFHAGAYLSRGDLYAERNDYAMAVVNYSQTIKYSPNDYQAYFKRGKMYEQRGDIRMAMDDYLTTTKLNPKVYEAWFKHGMSYYNNKNWHYAIVDFTELIKHNPNNQELARLYRGKCFLNLDEFQSAFDDFTVALHLNPNDWESFYHRGCLLRRLDPRQALQDFSVSLLIENGYDNMNSYLHRGILYFDNGRYDEAIKDFESVLQLDKEFAPAYVNLGIIYMNLTMNYWMAIKQFNLAIKSNPVYIRAYLCRAQAYRCIHDLKKAYLDYTKAIHLDPLNTQIYIYRGQVILEMGNLELAAFCVQHASFLNEDYKNKSKSRNESQAAVRLLSGKNTKRDNAMAMSRISDNSSQFIPSTVNQSVTQRALVFSFLKDYKKAIAVLDYELKLKPSTDIYNLLGRVYMKAKDWQLAVATFDKSIELNHDDSKNPSRSLANMSNMNPSVSKLANHNPKTAKKDLIDAYFMRGQCLLELFKSNLALESFDKVIDLKPNNAEAYYFRGLSRVNTNHSKCIQDFNKALAINPKLFEAFLARACIYGMEGRFTKAILNCNQAVKINPKSVRGYLYRGALKYLARSSHHAIHDLSEAIKLDQTCALAFYNRALCYQQVQNYKNALKDFSVVLMIGNYLKYKVYINRGLLYFSLKDYSNALEDFKLAAEFTPGDHKIHHMIGICLHKLERYVESIEKLSESFHLNHEFYDSLISRANVYVDFGKEEAFVLAQKDYEHVIVMDSRNIDAHINLAYLYQITGRFMKAWQQFTTAMQIKPDIASIYEGRSVVCLQMSDTAAALKDINQAIRLKPTAELYVNRGVIYQFMADNVNAMRDYQTAIMMNPKYGLAYYNSANIYLLHRQYNQAITSLDLAIDKCEMKDESTYQNRAIAKAFNNESADAFRDLCEAIKYGAYSAHIFMNRGLLLYKMENYKLAEKDFSTAIDLAPNDALLFKLRADCRGKLERKDEAIADYKIAVDLQFREEMRRHFMSKNKQH